MYPSAFTSDGHRFLAYVRDAGFLAGDFQKGQLARVDAGDIEVPIIYAVQLAR